jgi:hypothetical protein
MANIIDMRDRAASIARVEKLTRQHTEFQRAQAAAKEADSQRRIHIRAIEHWIQAAWVAPTMGPDLTRQAVAAILERLGQDNYNSVSTYRDSLELLTAGKE